MPYALKERQREYQRRWAKNRKAVNDISSHRRDTIVVNGSPINLKLNTITWIDLMKGTEAKAKTFNECVVAAKKFIMIRRTNRMAVASLVLRACKIKHGGKFSEEDQKLTLTAFAKKTNIHPKTLNDWVRLKTQVVDNLSGEEVVDLTAAASALNNIRGFNGDGRAAYFHYANEDPFKRRALLVESYIRNAHQSLQTFGPTGYNEDAKQRIRGMLEYINACFRVKGGG